MELLRHLLLPVLLVSIFGWMTSRLLLGNKKVKLLWLVLYLLKKTQRFIVWLSRELSRIVHEIRRELTKKMNPVLAAPVHAVLGICGWIVSIPAALLASPPTRPRRRRP